VARAPNLPGFKDHFALGPALAKAFGGLHVTIDNDVRVAVVGEHRAGAGRPYNNLLAVFLGTGVGGGLVLGGKLHHGRGNAGEIGHTVVQHGGRLCGCGRRGCLEAYASRGRIEYQARKLVEKGQKTVLFDLMEKRKRDRLTSGVIAAALEEKDKMTVKLLNDAVTALSVSLASVQNVLDLEAIIIGGGLGDRLGQPFVDRVAKAMKPHLFIDDNPPKMLTTELGDLSGAVGAALLAQEQLASAALESK
jgi:glucokinase